MEQNITHLNTVSDTPQIPCPPVTIITTPHQNLPILTRYPTPFFGDFMKHYVPSNEEILAQFPPDRMPDPKRYGGRLPWPIDVCPTFYEDRIIWLDDPDLYPYLIEGTHLANQSPTKPFRWANRWPVIGYATLFPLLPGGGNCTLNRRIFLLHPRCYLNAALDRDAIDPRTVRPGVPGWRTERCVGPATRFPFPDTPDGLKFRKAVERERRKEESERRFLAKYGRI
jgi:hypothetical protein